MSFRCHSCIFGGFQTGDLCLLVCNVLLLSRELHLRSMAIEETAQCDEHVVMTSAGNKVVSPWQGADTAMCTINMYHCDVMLNLTASIHTPELRKNG